MEDSIRVEYTSLEEIKKWPRNPKDHDLHEIRKSFYRFGFIKPILIDEGTGQLVAGHGRLDTLKLLRDNDKSPPRGVRVIEDQWLVPVLRGVAFKDPAEAEAFLIADNRLSEIGGWDEDTLSEILSEMVDVDGLLEGTGFDIAEVMDMLNPKDRGNIDLNIKANPKGENYLIMIVCDDEDQQSELLEELISRGVKCKGMVE